MAPASETEGVVRYQFQIDDDDWNDWKDTVPRRKSLEQRIIELIAADTEGRVITQEFATQVSAAQDDLERAIEANDWAAVEDAAARLEAANE